MKPEIATQFHAEAIQAQASTRPLLTIPEASNPALWALAKRRIGQGASPLAKNSDIPYTFDHFPFAREPLEQTVDPDVQTSVWVYGSGLGKTEQFLNVAGYCVEHSPRNIMAVWPKDDLRDYNSQNLVQRSLIDATPSLRALFSDPKSRDSGNTIELKRFAGGSLLMRSARVAANFAGPRCGLAYAGEVDRMVDTTEGDPLELLWMRCVGFDDAIQIIEGTPSFLSVSRSWGNLLKSDFRKWFSLCRGCKARIVWMYKDLKWPEQGKNRHEKAVLLCPECARAHDNAQRIRSVRAGIWKPTQDFNGIRGYWLNGFNTLLPAKKGFKGNNLYEFAANASRAAHANNRKEAVQVWTNTFLAEPSLDEEADAKQDWRKLYDRREAYPVDGRIPQGVITLSGGTDVQADRIEAEIVGYGKDEESWGIENAIFFCDPRRPESWIPVEAWFTRILTREDGARLAVKTSGFDTGYSAAIRALYEFIRYRQGRFHALKGASLIDAPLVARSKASKVDRVSLKMVGTHRIKDLLYDRALLETAGPGYMHFPGKMDAGGQLVGVEAGYDEEWFKQFLSETPYPIYKAGVRLRQFKHEKINGHLERNEKLDIRVYGLAALYLRGPINWEAEERANLATVPATGEQAKVVIPAKGFRQGGGFRAGGGSWRR